MRSFSLALLFVGGLACGAADSSGTDDNNDTDNDTTVSGAEQEIKKCTASTGPSSKAAADRLWAGVPASWQTFLSAQREQDYFPRLAAFVETARRRGADKPVYPAEEDTFTALKLAAPDKVRVVILGQDPYFNPGEAHGLAFSVKSPTRPPPSLRNVFKELESDVPNTQPVEHGSLVGWAKQGVLLLNAILTVEGGTPGSHACQGWETFSDAIITGLSQRSGDKLVFVLWGAFAQSKIPLIDPRHVIIKGAHPSPLSAKNFLGSKPFSQVNATFSAQHRRMIDWQLPATAAD